MKHKRRSVLCGLLAMIAATGMGGLTSDFVSAKDASVSGSFYREAETEPVSLEPVNKSKGVTYVYSDTGSISAINLNGNSAVIESVLNPDDEETYTKIYIDANKNGKVDAGETAVKLPKVVAGEVADEGAVSEYIDSTLAVFGVYQAIANEPIMITNKADLQTLFGVYRGEAKDVTLNNTGSVKVLFAASESTVSGNIILNNTEANMSTTYAAQNCTVTGDITMVQKNSPAGQVMGASGGKVIGNVSLTISFDKEVDGSCAVVFAACNTEVEGRVKLCHQGGTVSGEEYAVNSGSVESKDTSEPAVIVDVQNGLSVGNVGAVRGAEITSKAPVAVQYVANNHKLQGSQGSNIYIVHSSKVTAAGDEAVAVDVDVLGASEFNCSSFCGVCSPNSQIEIAGDVDVNIQLDKLSPSYSSVYAAVMGMVQVNGDVREDLKNMYFSVFYGINGYTTGTTGGNAVITGDLTIDMKGCQFPNAVYGANYALVNGDLSITGDEATYLQNTYIAYGTTVKGAVSCSLYGRDPDTSKGTSPTSLYGLSGAYTGMDCTVGKDLNIELLGGEFSTLQAVYSGGMKGNVTVDMQGIQKVGYSCNMFGNVAIEGNATITADDTCSLAGGLTCIYSAGVKGDVKIDIHNAYEPSDLNSSHGYFYGVNYATIEGNLDISVVGGYWSGAYGTYNSDSSTNPNYISGRSTVSLKDMIVSDNIYGLSGGVYKETVDVKINNCIKTGNYSGYVYGLQNGTYEKAAEVTIADVKGNTTIYGEYYAKVAEELILTLSANRGVNTCYVLYGGSCGGDITAKASDMAIASSFYGASFSVACGGNLDITLDSIKSSSYWYGVASSVNCGKKITLTANDCASVNNTNIVNYIEAAEGVQVDLNDCQFNNVNSLYFTPKADSCFNINGGVYNMSGSLVSATGQNQAKISVNFKGATIGQTYTNAPLINNYASGDCVLETYVDSTCVLPDSYEVIANTNNTCPAMANVKGDYYFSGTYPVTGQMLQGADRVFFDYYSADLPGFTAKNISIRYSSLAVPENEKVVAENGFLLSSVNMVLEGTLEGACNSQTYATFYMNGGGITNKEFDEAANKYYLVTLEYDKNAMTVSDSLASIASRPDLRFAGPDSVPSIKCTMIEGFQLGAGTYRAEGDETASNMKSTTSGSTTTFSFDMVDKPVTVTIESAGNQILVGKTVADPVAVRNKEYTVDKPLYDFGSLLIYNDGSKGAVSYALKAGETLPSGLSLTGGKLIGTATVKNEAGTKVCFVVTGKNGSTAEVILNIIVSDDPDAIQTSQDGRIIVDDTAKTINCMGSSIIIDSLSEETAIYLDDNRDGKKDYEEPAVKGGYNDYTLYGLHTYETMKPIQITMQGGTLKNLYAVYNGKVTTDNCDRAVSVILNGGTVSQNIYGAMTGTVTEGVYVKRASVASTSGIYTYDSASKCGYGFLDNANAITVSGDYTISEDMTADSFTIAQGTSSRYNSVTVPEGVTLTAQTMRVNNYSNVYNRGTVNCTGNYTVSGGYIYHYVMDDGKVLPEDNTFSYLYYPITVSYDSKNLPKGVTAPTISGARKYEGVQYGSVDAASSLSCSIVSGYEVYYTVNGGEAVSLGIYTGTGVSGTAKSVYGERKQTDIHVLYVAKEIEAVVRFGAPTAEIGKEYTEEEPLYDYATVTLNNDTTGNYGNTPTYVLQHGNSLPSGLFLKNGKVIGTPTGENGSSVPVTVVITGKNGTAVEVTLTYEVTGDVKEGTDINEVLSYNGSVLDLNGTSVVMYAASSNSNYVNIYLDENHDGVADNARAFTYKGSADLNLTGATVYGYRDTAKTFDGDISIYAYGGNVGTLYGAYGTSSSQNAVVNGKVSLYMRGAGIGQCLAAGYYASADELNLDCTAGTFYYKVFGAYNPGTVKNVRFAFTKDAMFYNTSSNTSYYMAVTEGGKVTGNVYATVGGTTNSFSTSTSSTNRVKFYGVYNTEVGGEVDYIVQGNWYTYQYNNHFAYQAKITGDMNVDWRNGRVAVAKGNTLYSTFANNCTIKDLNINVAENAAWTGSSVMYPYYGGTIRKVYMNVPNSGTSTISSALKHPYSNVITYPQQEGYMNLRGQLFVMGEYTLDEDFAASTVTIYENAKLKIAKGITLTVTGLINSEGDIENAGVLEAGSTLIVAANKTLVNTGTVNTKGQLTLNAGATLDNQGSLTSQGAVYNYGETINSGEWTSNGVVNLASSSAKIINENVWNAESTVYMSVSGAQLTNAGEWTTNKVVQITQKDAEIVNTGSWNMNYGVYVSYGRLENTGTFIGKYYGTGSTYCVYLVNNGTITNTGNWYGDAYIYIGGTFDNAGTLEVNPRPSGTSYNMYIQSSSALINRENATIKLNSSVSNAGKIVNYGTFRQTYTGSGYNLGTIYTTKKLGLAGDISNYSLSYNKFYYPVTVEYPEKAVTGVSLPTASGSGIEGDENQYLRAGDSFNVTLNGYKEGYTEADVKSVIYGTAETEAVATGTENQWKGTAPYESTVVQVNVAKNDATQIEIEPAEVTIDKLTVNQRNNSIYDLKNLKITGDDGTEGAVNYAVSVTKPLPEGLTLSNGVISGTPKYASAEPYTAEIIVTGKNLTKATLKLTFAKIEKAVPTLSVPTGIYGYTNYTLAQVRGYSQPSTGTFSWPDSSVDITEKCLAGEKFDLYFTPNDTDNYDWSKISASTGKWNAEAGRVECEVSIRMYTITPSYTVPTDITAVYGQTLEEVELPSDENGGFVWNTPSTSVGSVGSRNFYANYVPKDKGRYSTVSLIRVTVTVQPKELTAPIPKNLVTFEGNTIGQVALPKVEAGTYKWITAANEKVEEGKSYKAVFIPDDTTNYKWTIGDGAAYSNAYGGYVFDVTIEVKWHEEGVHEYETKYNEASHWKECICGDITDRETHTLDDMKNKGATHIAACTGEDCGYTKEEAHTYTRNQDASNHWSECECGDIIGKTAHVYTKTVYNDTKHWKECSCGMKSNETAHTFSTEKSDSTSHWKQCSCGAKTEIAKHSYTELSYDEENHWYACSCGAKNSVEAHVYGNWICDNTDNVHYAVCDCGSKKTAEHSYGGYTSTGAQEHKRVCEDCGGEITAKHSWDAGVITVTPTQFKEGLKKYTCTACGETREEVLPKNKPPHIFEKNLMSYDEDVHWIVCDDGDEFEMDDTREAHTFSEWKTDDKGHYKECICGYKLQEGEHIWQLVAGVESHWSECSICGMTKSEAKHSYSVKTDEVNHWKGCVCGKRIDVEQHAYVSYKYNTATHWDECSCGKRVNVASHSYGKWRPDIQSGKHFHICACGSRETVDHSEEYVWTSRNANEHNGVCADCGSGAVTEKHTWDAGRVTTSPTTTAAGVKTYTCTKCRETKTESIAKLPEDHKHEFGEWTSSDAEHWQSCTCGDEQKRAKHTWNTGIVTKEPTEEEAGNKVYRCIVCGKERSEELPKLTHEHSYSESYTYDETYHWRACGCDAITGKAVHSWNKGQVIKPATLEATGTMQYTCTVCGAVKLSILPKLEETHIHSFGSWVMTDDLSHTRSCSCGANETKTHSFGSWTADGVNRHKKTCSECDHVIYDKHAWDAGKVTTEATEEKEGVITYTCKICKTTKTETYTIEDHVHSYGVCTPVDDETHKQNCEECDEEFVSVHSFDEGSITKKPTVTAEGEKTYTCTECGYKKTESVEKLPADHKHTYGEWEKHDKDTHKKVCIDCDELITETHSWNSGVITVAASETAEGVRTYTCDICGETKTEVIAKLPPTTEESTTETPTTERPDNPKEGEPVGTEFTDEGSNAKFTVVNPADIDPEDTDSSPAVVYTGSTKASAKEITIPDTITVGGVVYRVVSIADGAFKNNKGLTKVTIGTNVKTIGNSAFENCKALNTVTFKNISKVKTIGKKAFYKCIALKKITIPKSVVTIKDSAFDGCKKLATVTFQSGSKLKKLGKKVFNGCVVLKKITIPKMVTSIGASAFSGCKKLATIKIQSTKLKTVGKKAFKGIKSNAKIKVPSKQLKVYKKLLKGKGQSKKVKITK